jgi:hypothetical protein
VFRRIIQSLVIVAALAVLFITPVWTESSGGFAVLPVWWPDRVLNRGVIWTGALTDALALLALVVAVTWPRIRRR